MCSNASSLLSSILQRHYWTLFALEWPASNKQTHSETAKPKKGGDEAEKGATTKIPLQA